MTRRVEEVLPKREWWKQAKSLDEYCESLAAQRDALRSLPSTTLASLPWSHCVVVEGDDARLPNYFCGQACCVEVASISFLGRQRLAVWWTGERIGEHMQYGPVPPTFFLVPYLEDLGQFVLDIIVGCGYKRVSRGMRRPGKNQFWLELNAEEQRIIVRFHTKRSANKAHRALLGVEINFRTDPTYDIVVHPDDNIIR